uniref:BED-type domain-containing protein n=1 Tax=Cucumis melo TaxID=3656 RepID=A0A9I9ED14_CUCME
MVWDHFERLKGDPNDPHAKCKYCGVVYACHSKRNGIGTMKHHLENCKKYPYQKKRDQTQMTLAFKPKDKVGDNSSQLVCESFSLDGCQDALVEMIIVDELPFKFVEGKRFNNMKAKFEKYWGNNEKNNLLLYVAIVLDPRKKLRFVVESMGNVVEQCYRRLFHEYSTTQSGSRQGCSSTSTTSTQTVSGLDANIDFDSNENVGEDFVYDTIVEEFEDDSTTPFEQGSSEIDIYLLEANVRTEGDFDILQWWKMNSDRFEVLGQMARDILAIPVSTVASESAFSTGGRVIDSSRCSLAPKTVEALICTQNWLNSNPIHLQFEHELEEASKFEEGFRVVMENEKELEDLPDFDKLSITDY